MKELWISKGLVLQKQVKNNTDKNEQSFGCHLENGIKMTPKCCLSLFALFFTWVVNSSAKIVFAKKKALQMQFEKKIASNSIALQQTQQLLR